MNPTIESTEPGSPVVSPRLVLGWQTGRPARTIVHELLHSEEPVVSLAAPGVRRGTLSYFFESAEAAATCWDMHTATAVFTLTAPVSDSVQVLRYVVTGGDLRMSLDEATAKQVVIEVPYLEVPA